MSDHFHPQGDQEFEAWVENFNANLAPILGALGLPPTFDDALLATHAAFSGKLVTHTAAQAAARAARQDKDDSKRECVQAMRVAVRQLRANPLFTDAMAELLGLPVYDRKATPKRAGGEAPTLRVEHVGPQAHAISFWQMTEGRDERAPRPDWARAMRLVRAIVEVGEPCPPIEKMEYLASDTASPYVATFDGTTVGKDAYYRGAWETPRGDVGPWSAAVRATVSG